MPDEDLKDALKLMKSILSLHDLSTSQIKRLAIRLQTLETLVWMQVGKCPSCKTALEVKTELISGLPFAFCPKCSWRPG